MGLKNCGVIEATHVKVGGVIERIVDKWGIDKDGHLAKPSEGGFGCITATGRRVTMMEADVYYAEDPPPVKLYVRAILPPDLVAAFHQHIRDFDTRYDPRHEGKVHVDMVGKSEWPVEQMLEVYEAMSPQPETMMVAREHYRIWRTPLLRWIVLHPKENVLAWTGSGWAIHKDGVGRVVQISNFPTAEEADAYARDTFGPPENTELKT